MRAEPTGEQAPGLSASGVRTAPKGYSDGVAVRVHSTDSHPEITAFFSFLPGRIFSKLFAVKYFRAPIPTRASSLTP